jgi:hypothetical protein
MVDKETAIQLLKEEIKKSMKEIRSKNTTKVDRQLQQFRVKCLKIALRDVEAGQ